MFQEETQGEEQALGAFLRDHREKMDASLEDVAEATKISLPILRAIEEDNYERMPAEAFCRGFYTMYADFLSLDPEEILTRYQESRGQPSPRAQKQARPPIKKSRHFSTYAEPAAVSPATSLGMLLLIGLTVIIGICWYFNLNPTKYLGNQLDTAPNIEEPAPHDIQSSTVSNPQEIKDKSPLKTEQNTWSPGSDGEMVQQVITKVPLEATAAGPYHLEIDFTSEGSLNITLDDGPLIEKHFTAGKTLYWDAEKAILLDMPEEIGATLRLNGVEQPLPEGENGRRFFSFPKDSL